ncbi:MAG: flotillin family protein [Candidatus Sericytochromatia bacterium]
MQDMVTVVAILVGLGVFLLVGLLFAASKLYVKTPSSRAFVRTGSGKAKVVLDGGAWVIPLLHEIRWVSLETMRIEVKRGSEGALITGDKLRADVSAEFYIRVEPTEQQILAASRSLGNRSVAEEEVDTLIAPKLISALRSVAAQKSLMELHEKRDGFADAVHQIVKSELDENGLLLETVTISNLDASTFRSDENYFDAQGVSHITETIQKASSRKNEIEQSTKETIARKNVDTRKAILLLEREQKEAELQQELEINRMEIEQQRQIESETAEKQASQEQVKITQQQAVEEARIKQDLAVKNARVSSEIDLLERAREKDTVTELAKVSVEKARLKAEIEIVEQNKDKEIVAAQAQSEVLHKEKERLEFDAQRERARQELLTVEEVEKARRLANIEIIEAETAARKETLARQAEIELQALKLQREAQAKFDASDLEARAMERLAEAELARSRALAEGERLMLEARNSIGSNLLLQELIQVLPEVMKELASPVGKINDIKLIHMGGMGTGANGKPEIGGLGETLLKSTMLYPLLKELMDSQGVDLTQFLKDLMQRTGQSTSTRDVTVRPEPVSPQPPAATPPPVAPTPPKRPAASAAAPPVPPKADGKGPQS